MLIAIDSNVVVIALAPALPIFLLIPYAAAEYLAQGSYVMLHYNSLLIVLKTGRIPTR